MTLPPLALAASASPLMSAVAGLYGITKSLDEFLDGHIDTLKASNNPTICTTGRILEGAKQGFGLGYVSSVAVVAVGQFLLGNTVAAGATVFTAVTLTNPVAMTCASVGAIVYGWHALDEQQREDILEAVAAGLRLGRELIRAVVAFAIDSARRLLGSALVKDLVEYTRSYAAAVGRGFSIGTDAAVQYLGDAKDGAQAVLEQVGQTGRKTGRQVIETMARIGNAGTTAVGKLKDSIPAPGQSLAVGKQRSKAKA